jgi:hypothetical protein
MDINPIPSGFSEFLILIGIIAVLVLVIIILALRIWYLSAKLKEQASRHKSRSTDESIREDR